MTLPSACNHFQNGPSKQPLAKSTGSKDGVVCLFYVDASLFRIATISAYANKRQAGNSAKKRLLFML